VPAFSYMRSLYIDWGMVLVGGNVLSHEKGRGIDRAGKCPGGIYPKGKCPGEMSYYTHRARLQARLLLSCGVRPSVRLSVVRHVHVLCDLCRKQ